MIQVKIGTVEWKACPDGVVEPGYVLFTDVYLYRAGSSTKSAMIWDAALVNIRAMTQAELDAAIVAEQAARDAAQPDLAALRDQGAALLNQLNNLLSSPAASNTLPTLSSQPTLAQVNAMVNQINAITTGVVMLAQDMQSVIRGIRIYAISQL